MPTKEELMKKYKPINRHKEVPYVGSGRGFVIFSRCFLLCTRCSSQQQPRPARFLDNKNLNCIALCEGTRHTILTALTPPSKS